MQLRIRYDLGAGPVDVTALPWHVMLLERRYKVKASQFATAGLGLDEIAYLAYEATKTTGGGVPAKFDEWAQHLRSIDVIGDEADPTRPVPSDDSSPSSPSKPE